MKSPQLVRLQQQFLKSLHAGPSQWLLNEIEPAEGFGSAENVLNAYLARAVSRTVDPLKQIYRHVRWILGPRAFESLLQDFYAESFGEPLSSTALSVEFAAFIEDSFDHKYCDLLHSSLTHEKQSSSQLRALIIGVAMLDWRLNWCELAPRVDSTSPDELLRLLNHRSHLWARPRLDRGTRVFHSIVDFHHLFQADQSKPRTQPLELHNQPIPYLIYYSGSNGVKAIAIDDATQRILSQCDGTHTLSSILYEAILFGDRKEDIITMIRQLIADGVIVRFQFDLTTQ